MNKEFYTVQDIQNILRIGKNKAYELVNSGVIPSMRIGNAIRIKKSVFDEWAERYSNKEVTF